MRPARPFLSLMRPRVNLSLRPLLDVLLYFHRETWIWLKYFLLSSQRISSKHQNTLLNLDLLTCTWKDLEKGYNDNSYSKIILCLILWCNINELKMKKFKSFQTGNGLFGRINHQKNSILKTQFPCIHSWGWGDSFKHSHTLRLTHTHTLTNTHTH